MLEEIKKMAKELGVGIKDVLAMSRGRDPFGVGTEADRRDAAWAKTVWDWVLTGWEAYREELRKLGYSVGKNPHLRAIHYLYMTGYPNPIRPNGKRYIGTFKDWVLLGMSFAKAKVLKLIPFGVMEDRKHPHPEVNLQRGEDDDLNFGDAKCVKDYNSEDVRYYVPLSGITSDLKLDESKTFKDMQSRIPYHIEFWLEKDSELVSEIAKKHFVNVQPSVGEQTWENVVDLLERAIDQSEGKPIRIYYITDFDPRGEISMPKAVSRKIEWLINNVEDFKGLNIKLKKIILTENQVKELKLPPAPVKPKESMRKKWIAKHGDSIVELNTIETLHPTEFVRIFERALEPYIDQEAIKVIEDFNEDLGNAASEYNDIVEERLAEQTKKIDEELARRINPVVKGFEASINIDVSQEMKKVEDIQDSWEEPEWKDPEEDDSWLFDSSRTYLDQLAVYKKLEEICGTKKAMIKKAKKKKASMSTHH